jgi:hypothetical protein
MPTVAHRKARSAGSWTPGPPIGPPCLGAGASNGQALGKETSLSECWRNRRGCPRPSFGRMSRECWIPVPLPPPTCSPPTFSGGFPAHNQQAPNIWHLALVIGPARLLADGLDRQQESHLLRLEDASLRGDEGDALILKYDSRLLASRANGRSTLSTGSWQYRGHTT